MPSNTTTPYVLPSVTQSPGGRPPSINGFLFVDSSANRIDYSGTASITREDLMALCDYMFSDRAESDQYGIKLYISGWKKASQRTGKTYLSLQIEPPRAVYDGVPPAPRLAAPPQKQVPAHQAPAGAPPQPVWDATTGTWLLPVVPPAQVAPPAPPVPPAQMAPPAPPVPPAQVAPPAPPVPPAPVWDPQSQAWLTPPAPGAGGAPGQPYQPPMPADQAGAVWHSGGHTPAPVSDADIPF